MREYKFRAWDKRLECMIDECSDFDRLETREESYIEKLEEETEKDRWELDYEEIHHQDEWYPVSISSTFFHNLERLSHLIS